MVVVSLPPTLQPLSALANQNTAPAQTNAANSATTTGNLSNLNNNIFNGLIKKFEAGNTSAQQANAPVVNNINYLTQQLNGQINQNPSTNGNTPTNAGSNANTNITTTVSQNSLNANLAKWEDYLADNDYSFTLQQISNGQNSGPININVTDGAISSASYPDGSAVSAEVLNSLLTIEQMFDNIRQYNGATDRADALYNPSRGYPEFVLLSHNEQTSADNVSYILNNVNINV